MKFEVLKRSHLKRNIIVGIIVVTVISAIVINFTRAKYKTAQSVPLYNATVNYTPYDFKMVAMYQENSSGEYESVDTVPTSGYALNTEESYCEVNNVRDNNIQIEYNSGQINFLGMTAKGTRCYLYFDEQKLVKDTLLSYYQTVRTRTNFNSTVTDTTTGVIYKSANSSQYDNDGEVYYFAGNPTDNWVYFAGFYWRIIRINGDGSIRLIYQGTSANTTGTGTQIGTSAYNSSYRTSEYVGYMYTQNQAQGTDTSSTIKENLDEWYKTNIQEKEYDSYIGKNAGFCNDRTIYRGSGTGRELTEYQAYDRLVNNKNPSYKCQNDIDLFTTSESNKGNKKLTYPVGLITADEIAFAGGVVGSDNNSYYLYTNQYYWTMTPYNFDTSYDIADVFFVYTSGNNGYSYVHNTWAIRPVINLKADVTISSGNGTSTQPFVIATS